jgi:hypothetical protein
MGDGCGCGSMLVGTDLGVWEWGAFFSRFPSLLFLFPSPVFRRCHKRSQAKKIEMAIAQSLVIPIYPENEIGIGTYSKFSSIFSIATISLEKVQKKIF